jgi:hypothetical protein
VDEKISALNVWMLIGYGFRNWCAWMYPYIQNGIVNNAASVKYLRCNLNTK